MPVLPQLAFSCSSTNMRGMALAAGQSTVASADCFDRPIPSNNTKTHLSYQQSLLTIVVGFPQLSKQRHGVILPFNLHLELDL